MITELQSLNIHEDELTIDMSSFDLDISGGKLLELVFEGVVSLVNKIAKNKIVNQIEGPIKDVIKEKVVGKTLEELMDLSR